MSARLAAYEVVRRTFEEGAYADRAFPPEADRANLDERDRRLAMRLAYGTVQRVRTLDYAMEALGIAAARAAPADAAGGAAARAPTRSCSPAASPTAPRSTRRVELAKAVAGRHTAGLANAVLRRVAEAGPEWVVTLRPALRHSYPDWIAGEWTAMLGEDEAAALMAAQNEPPELAVRVNTLRPGPIDLGVPAHGDPELPEALVLDGHFDVAASRELADGAIWPQSRGSMLAARLLAPEPGMRVLDLCSAPGGKAGQLAALMGDRGRLQLRRAPPRPRGGARADTRPAGGDLRNGHGGRRARVLRGGL